MPKDDKIFFEKWLPIILVVLAILTIVMLYKNVRIAKAGTYTTNNYGYIPAFGETGEENRLKYNIATERADRGIKAGNLAPTCVEYPTTNDNFGARRITSSLEVSKVIAVLQSNPESNEWVKLTIAHGTDRSTTGAYLISSQTINSNTAGDTIISFVDATIDTDEWVWNSIDGVSGNIEELCITIEPSIK